MRAVFLSENLKDYLSFLNQAVSAKTTLPILSNFLINIKRGTISFSATDLEIGARVEVPAQTEGEGETAVLAKALSELLGSLSDGKTTFEVKDNQLLVSSEKSKSVFQTTDPAEFPRLYEEKGEEAMAVKKETIEKDLKSVVFAVSSDPTRPIFSGVLVRREGQGDFLMVATDAHRLSLRKGVSLKAKKGAFDKNTIVSSRAIKNLIGQKGGQDVTVFISDKNNQIIFDMGQALVVGRLLEGEFPAYEKIIPHDFSVRAEFEKEEMQQALKIAEIFARDGASIVKFSISKDKITITSSGSLGQNAVEIEAKTEGEENEIAFNARYVLELLTNVGGNRIIFEMSGPLNPGVFKIANDPNFLHLIMPIRVNE